MRSMTIPILLTALSSLNACAWHEPTRVEEDFGKSVRQMIDAQIDSPSAATTPALRGPNRLDGASAVHTVDRYEASGKTGRRGTGVSVPGITQ